MKLQKVVHFNVQRASFGDSFGNQACYMVNFLTFATCLIFDKNNASSFSQYIYKLKMRYLYVQ